MENCNDTVKDVCDKSLRNITDTFGKRVRIFDGVADDIEAAHEREMAEERRISNAVIQSLRDDKLKQAGQIAKLLKMKDDYANMQANVTALRHEVSMKQDQMSKNGREYREAISKREDEIARLRELASELLNKLVINHCIGCQVDDCDRCVYYAQNEAVAAKAREIIGGDK